MSTTSMSDAELTALMSEVKGELDVILKAEAEKLSKAHPGEETPAEIPADDSASAPPEGSESSPAPESAPPADDVGDAASAPPPEASESPADPAGQDPAMDAQEMDPEAIKAELVQLPPEHIKALYLACKEVLFSMMGDAGSPPAPESAPPAAPPMAPPASPSAPPAMKAEMKAASPSNGGKTTVVKSEKDLKIEALEKKVLEFEGITSGLLNVVEKAISVPARKAVTSVAELSKSAPSVESLSKSEIKHRLDVAARTNLNKSDRELINRYSVGAIGLEKISHLLGTK